MEIQIKLFNSKLLTKKIIYAAVITLTCLLLTNCHKTKDDKKIPTIIRHLITAFPSQPSIGVVVENLSNKHILYQHNMQRSFVPASTTKTLTTTTALNFLGPNYHFTTRLSTDAKKMNNGIVRGNIYLQFSGDPSFKYQDLKTILATLIRLNINTINGSLIIEIAPFPHFKQAPDYMWDDFNFCFSAPSDAVILNHNCFEFTMSPNSFIGKSTILVSKHSLEFTPIENSVTTKLDGNNECPLDLYITQHNHYQLSGCIDYLSPPLHFDVAVKNPHYLLKQYIQQWLQQHHIKLRGTIQYAPLKSKTNTLLLHQSAPLFELLKHMLKISDNLYANNIFKTIGAIYFNQAATWKNGAAAEMAILQKIGIDTNQINIVDGAGLSRYDRFSPQVLLQILNYNYDHPQTGQYFYNGLVITGIDDKFRPLSLGQYDGNFRAKTGSMQAVATIAGYVKTANGTSLAIVVMINGKEQPLTYFGLIRNIVYSLASAKI